MTVAPYLLGRRGKGAYVAPGSGSGEGDGGIVDPVVTTTSTGDTTVKGQVKPGSFGKFVVPLATVQAGRQYTFRYTPNFTQLAQQGKLAMVGFGFKNGNDFHIAGLRGDGSTGLHKYQVYGTPPNGWNKDTGHTTNDGGAAASGTQAGPNYLRIVISATGATYKLQSSTDGSTWNDEFTGQTPSPFSNVSGATTFGVALWFNNADAGPFSIVIDQFADAVVPAMTASFEGAASDASNLTTYTFTNKNVGAAGTGRVIAVAVQTRPSAIGTPRSVSGVTCNGNAMTAGPAFTGGSGGQPTVAWFYIVEPTGTTATFVVTFSNGTQNCAIATYRLFPVSSTPVDTAVTTLNSPTSTLTDLEVKTQGLALILVDSGRTATPQLDSFSWNGVDSPVRDLTDQVNDQSGALNLFSIPTTENDTTRDFAATAAGDQVVIAGMSFQ